MMHPHSMMTMSSNDAASSPNTTSTREFTQLQNASTNVPVQNVVPSFPINVPLNCGLANGVPVAVLNTNAVVPVVGNAVNNITTISSENNTTSANNPGVLLLNLANNGQNIMSAISQLVGNNSLRPATPSQTPVATPSIAMTTVGMQQVDAAPVSMLQNGQPTVMSTTAVTNPQLQNMLPTVNNNMLQPQTSQQVNPTAYVLVPLQNSSNQLNFPLQSTTMIQAVQPQAQIQHQVQTQMLQPNNNMNMKYTSGTMWQDLNITEQYKGSRPGDILSPALTQETVCDSIKSSANLALNKPVVQQAAPVSSLPTIFLPEFSTHSLASACSTGSASYYNNVNQTLDSKQNHVPQNGISKDDNFSGLDFLARVSTISEANQTFKQNLQKNEFMEINNNIDYNEVTVESNENERIERNNDLNNIAIIKEGTTSRNAVKTKASYQDSDVPKSKKKRIQPNDVKPIIVGLPAMKCKEKKRKGPAPKLSGDEVCSVCGYKASGYHYNVLSCEGCKGFFRRSIINDVHLNYQCKNKDRGCIVDVQTRRKCQYCRFVKCMTVGMREDCVVTSEDKKKVRESVEHPDLLKEQLCESLTVQQLNILKVLRENVLRFEWPTVDDVQKVTKWDESDENRVRGARFAHFTELSILMVQLVVEFTKQLPGFLSVERTDQIVLLKASAIELMLLRAAKQYNKHDGTISFLNGRMYDKNMFYKAGIQVTFVEPIFEFCESMARLNLDDAEYAILVAINTFSSDRPHITDPQQVEKMQDPYIELLRVYCKIHRPDDPLMFARILMKLVELRTLNNCHSEQVFALKLQDKRLPPLLAEIWDM